jgi:hypothetical protein
MRFRIGTDYKTEFNNAVTALVAQKIADRVERMAVIESLINEYMVGTGELPERIQLERLTDAILMEELTDMHPDKVTNNEFPFLSEWQFNLRRDNEYSLKLAEETDTNGRDHKVGKRRVRTSKENAMIDKYAKSRNEERRRQYRKDTEVSTVTTWHASPESLENYLVDKYGDWKLKYSK